MSKKSQKSTIKKLLRFNKELKAAIDKEIEYMEGL